MSSPSSVYRLRRSSAAPALRTPHSPLVSFSSFQYHLCIFRKHFFRGTLNAARRPGLRASPRGGPVPQTTNPRVSRIVSRHLGALVSLSDFPSRSLFQVVQLVRVAITAAVPHAYARAERAPTLAQRTSPLVIVLFWFFVQLGGFVSFHASGLACHLLHARMQRLPPLAIQHKSGDLERRVKRFGLPLLPSAPLSCRWPLKRLSSTSGPVIPNFVRHKFFFDSDFGTPTIRFLVVDLVRLPAVPFAWRPLRLALRARKVAKS